MRLSAENYEDHRAIAMLGEGWVAEEALTIAVYSALKYSGDFKKAVICAVNHDGDSDSTGAIAGNILGAYLGLPEVDYSGEMISKLEAYDVMYEISQEYRDVKWISKYVYCNYGEMIVAGILKKDRISAKRCLCGLLF